MSFRFIASSFFLIIGCCGLTFGCSDDESTQSKLTCTPDGALIAEARECRRDDQCPCASYCTLGRCAADCASSSDCESGQSCDSFGRCQAAGSEGIVTPRNSAGQGQPRILQAGIISATRENPQLLTIVADEGPIRKMRVTAEPGTEIALAEPGTESTSLVYTDELLIEAELAEGQSRYLYTRPVADVPLGDSVIPGGVTVVTESNNSTSVVIDDADSYVPPVQPSASLEGMYEGVARMVRSGASGPNGFEGSIPMREVSTLISAEVFPAAGDKAIIVLRDPLHLIHPDGEWVGQIVLGDEARVEMPAFEQVEYRFLAGSPMQVVTVPANGALASDPNAPGWSGSLRFTLDLEFSGASGTTLAPRQIWEIGIGRVSEPSGVNAPMMDAAAELRFDADVETRRPFLVEQAFLDAIAPATTSSPVTLSYDTNQINGPRVITVSHPQHGLANGDSIEITGATGSGAIYYNRVHPDITVLDANRYSYNSLYVDNDALGALVAMVNIPPATFEGPWLRDRQQGGLQTTVPNGSTTPICADAAALDGFGTITRLETMGSFATRALAGSVADPVPVTLTYINGGTNNAIATVTHPGHGMEVGAKAVVRMSGSTGDSTNFFNGPKSVTVLGPDTYTFGPGWVWPSPPGVSGLDGDPGNIQFAQFVPIEGPEFPANLGVSVPSGTPAVVWRNSIIGPLLDAMTFTRNGVEDGITLDGRQSRPSAQLFLGGDTVEDFEFKLISGDVLEFAVPCAFDFSSVPAASFGSYPTALRGDFDPLAVGETDYCARMLETYECVVVDLLNNAESSELERDFRLNLRLTDAGSSMVVNLPGARYAKACVFPKRSTGCIEAALCDDNLDTGALVPSRLSTTAGAAGDLSCGDGSAGMEMPMDGESLVAETLAQNCLDDIQTLLNLNGAGLMGSTPEARLESIRWRTTTTKGCLEPQRFLTLLGLSGETAREFGVFSVDRSADTTDAIFLRLIQRFLDAHNFAAAQATNGGELVEAFATGSAEAEFESALSVSLSAWDLLLHPRIGSALAGMSRSALADPDYRLRILSTPPTSEAHFTHDDGLLVSMMTLLATQMELIENIAEVNARAGQREVPLSISQALRRMGVIDSYISMLGARGGTKLGVNVPRWYPKYQSAQGRYESARGRALLSLSSAITGRNPLGIEEDDLPLYFSQVATDAGSRYTAISDYILGDPSNSVTGIATASVANASDAFTLAKSAYQNEEARQVNVINDDADWGLRVKTAKIELGGTIQDLCGESLYPGLSAEDVADVYYEDAAAYMVDVDPVTGEDVLVRKPGAVDFTTCWYRDLPECLEDKTAEQRLKDAQAFDDLVAQDVKETIEANALNDLCVAAIVGAQAQLARCDEELVFPNYDARYYFQNPYNPPQNIGGCLFDRTTEWNDDFCGAPYGNPTTRSAAASPGLERLGTKMSASPGWPVFVFQTFLKKGYNNGAVLSDQRRRDGCDTIGDATTIKLTPHVTWGVGPNFCTNAPQPTDCPEVSVNGVVTPAGTCPEIGPIPNVIYDPDAPEERQLRLECGSAVNGTMFTELVSNEDLQVSADVDPATLGAAISSCNRIYPRRFVGSTSPPRDFEVTKSVCYRGSLGSQAASLRGLVGQIQAARAELDSIQDEHRISMESCFILQQGNQQLNLAQSAYATQRSKLAKAKLAMDIAAQTARGVQDCISAVNGIDAPDTPTGIPGLVVDTTGAALECGAGAIATGFEIAATGLEFAMGELDVAHDGTMLAIETATDESRCFKEAELALVSQRTLELNVLTAMQEVESGYADFVDQVEKAELTAIRGVDNVNEMIASRSEFVGRNPWFNEEIMSYGRKMRVARRAAYLAVRAVEYEFQASLTERGDVLLAKDPDDLEQVLESLRSISATPSPNGNQPSSLTEIISLREHLLQLGSNEDAPEGELALSSVDRFRMRLLDPRYEVYENGEFVGREIPFTIAPLAKLNRGNYADVPIVADSSCGERLWSLNATILGDAERTFTGFAPQVSLAIRKRNTFFANWCGDSQEDFQVASTRPSKNLFRVPGVAEGFEGSGESQTKLFSEARIQALLDIQPGDFLTDAYVDGASTELAGRLLFGDYTLFIPASSLAAFDEDGTQSKEGLDLSQIEDIALRLDYISVAK